MSKTVYQINAQGLYVGPVQVPESPQQPGDFVVPPDCVENPPPTIIPSLKAACWNGQRWQLLDYFHGLIVYDTATGKALTLTGTGAIPGGYTTQRPGPDQRWDRGRWVDGLATQLIKLKVLKRALIEEGYAAYIVGGFDCAALGKMHRYDSALTDQVTLKRLLHSGLPGMVACRNRIGARVMILHSAEQLHKVHQDLMRFKQQARQQAEHLKNQLDHALKNQNQAAMNRIEWRAPEPTHACN